MKIQWYPGHMTKTKRMMQEHLALVDIVIELLDARIPYSSKNPDIDLLAVNKKRMVILNKSDLAAATATAQWEAYYKMNGFAVLAMDSRDKSGMARVKDTARTLMREKIERRQRRGIVSKSVRVMVAGIPNSGKSTFINRLSGTASAATGDKPGVTRGKQWIKLGRDFDLLDTPGVLWPKFEDEAVGVALAVTGAVSDDILDKVTLCEELLALLTDINPASYVNRYRLTGHEHKTPRAVLEMIGDARGFKMKGGATDIERAAVMVLDEYRAGKLGRITLELPPKVTEPAPDAPAPIDPFQS